MPYGTVKVDNVTFTNNSVDATTTFSGIYASITNNLTLSGTATAATFTGTTANFTNVNAQNISVTTSLSGLAITGGTAGFTTITGTTVTGTTANFVTVSGTTVTGTTANFVTVSGTTVTGNTGQFTNLAGAAAGFTTVTGTTITGTTANFVSGVFTTRILGTTVTGTTASFTSGVFTSLSGTTHTITSGVFASGTAALPSISFVSDPNTGIYSPGADQLAVATSGTQRITIDSSGRLLVGTATARANFYNSTNSARFQIEGSGTNDNYALSIVSNFAGNTNGAQIILAKSRGSNVGDNTLTVSGDTIGQINFQGADGTDFVRAAQIAAEVDGTPGANDMPGRLVFSTTADGAASPTERMRITSSGNVGIGTSAPGEALTVANGALQVTGTLISLNRPSSSVMDFQSSTGLTRFFSIGVDASTHGSYVFCTATTTTNIERVRIDQSGRVGIGTTPVVDLDVAPAASTATFRIHARSNTTPVAAIELVRGTSTTFGADGSGDYRIKNDTGNLSFEYGDSGVTSERARIDSSGRLLVGTSTSTNNYKVQAESTDFGQISIRRNVGGAGGPALAISHSRGSAGGSYTALVNGDEFGGIYFYGADGTQDVNGATITALVDGTPGANDMPGRLVFSTTADGASSPTERMRITSTGVLQIADAGNITVGTTTGTKIGTATTQKLGFYNATPVVQPTAVADATTAVDVITQLNNLLAKLRTLGIIAT